MTQRGVRRLRGRARARRSARTSTAFRQARRCSRGACPSRAMAARGKDTLRFGMLKPVGTVRCGRQASLRRPAAAQGKLRGDGVQPRRVPDKSEVPRAEAGVLHDPRPARRRVPALRRDAPQHLSQRAAGCSARRLFPAKRRPQLVSFAGQITGVEGYVESAAQRAFWPPAGAPCACKLRGIPPVQWDAATVSPARSPGTSRTPDARTSSR